jgi:hypothetical protein
VHEAALSQLGLDADARAAKIERLRAELEQETLSLRGVMGVPGFIPSAAVISALHDDLNTPVHLLRSRGDLDRPVSELTSQGGYAANDVQVWLDYLAQLEAGDGGDSGPGEDAAAA